MLPVIEELKGVLASTGLTQAAVAENIQVGRSTTIFIYFRDKTYILEAGFERLNGVDFKKGCYVGQEITARMQHKTKLKKGLKTVIIEGVAKVGTEILADGQNAGIIYSQSKGKGIAFLRLDRALPKMNAGNAVIFTETIRQKKARSILTLILSRSLPD